MSAIQAYRCPECGHIRDARDPDRHGGLETSGETRQRWCHNYRAHGTGSRRRMDAVELVERGELGDLSELLASIPGTPNEARYSVEIDLGYEPRGDTAVAFVAQHPTAIWSWMNVPANVRPPARAWYSLNVQAKIDGVTVKLDPGHGWDAPEAKLLQQALRDAAGKEDVSQTPAPFAYAGHSSALAGERP